MPRCKVKFLPDKKTAYVPKGTSIRDAALFEDILINSPCGGLGRCGKCRVQVLTKGYPAGRANKKFINPAKIKEGWRLACCCAIDRNLDIFIPPAVRIDAAKILSATRPARKRASSLSLQNFGLAFDIGTTTVVGALVDLDTRNEVSVYSRPNPQANYGADIISRINFALSKKDGFSILRLSILKCVNDIIHNLLTDAGVSAAKTRKVVFASNPVMQHIFLGADVSPLAHEPFDVSISSIVKGPAASFGLDINETAQAVFLPNIKSFVGSDCICTVISSGMYKYSGIMAAIDLGTNSEVVLGNKNRMLAASAAAGPAFEGAHISCGMPAKAAAIESVAIEDGRVITNVIGNVKPVGICGSGLVDSVSELLRIGQLGKDGRLKKDFILYRRKGVNIKINQKDIRQFQLAKAAIRAAFEILKGKYKIKDNGIKRIFISGAFGTYMRIESLDGIGLLPGALKSRISFIGNTSLAGAKMVLTSDKLLNTAIGLSKRVEHVSLHKCANFQKEFVKAMRF